MKKAAKVPKAKMKNYFVCNCGDEFTTAKQLKAHLTEYPEHSAKS